MTTDTVSRYDFANAAAALRGTPFVHQGRQPGVGLDCVGLIVAAAKACGMECHDARGYSTMPSSEFAMAEVAQGAEQVDIDHRAVGDILAFQYRPGMPTHFGVLLERDDIGCDTMIHSNSFARRATIESVDRRWLRMLHSVWRLRGVT